MKRVHGGPQRHSLCRKQLNFEAHQKLPRVHKSVAGHQTQQKAQETWQFRSPNLLFIPPFCQTEPALATHLSFPVNVSLPNLTFVYIRICTKRTMEITLSAHTFWCARTLLFLCTEHHRVELARKWKAKRWGKVEVNCLQETWGRGLWHLCTPRFSWAISPLHTNRCSYLCVRSHACAIEEGQTSRRLDVSNVRADVSEPNSSLFKRRKKKKDKYSCFESDQSKFYV